jgi:hypothetical protein
MESTRLLLNEALAPYRVALSPCGAHGECLVSVSNVEGVVLVEREINQAQLTDKPLLIDVVDGLHRDVLIAEGRLEPSMIATLRGVEQRRSFALFN